MEPEMMLTEVACPICGQVYDRLIETEYIRNEEAWYQGYPAISCYKCRPLKVYEYHGRISSFGSKNNKPSEDQCRADLERIKKSSSLLLS